MKKSFYNKENLIFQIEFCCENYISSVNNPELDNTCAFIAVLLRIVNKFKNANEVDIPDFLRKENN